MITFLLEYKLIRHKLHNILSVLSSWNKWNQHLVLLPLYKNNHHRNPNKTMLTSHASKKKRRRTRVRKRIMHMKVPYLKLSYVSSLILSFRMLLVLKLLNSCSRKRWYYHTGFHRCFKESVSHGVQFYCMGFRELVKLILPRR